MPADPLWFQCLTWAPGVLALAGYFQKASAASAHESLQCCSPSADLQVQAGCAHLAVAFMEALFIERALLSRSKCSVENLGHRVEQVSMLPPEHICPRPLRSIASEEIIVCSILLIMAGYVEIRPNGEPWTSL